MIGIGNYISDDGLGDRATSEAWYRRFMGLDRSRGRGNWLQRLLFGTGKPMASPTGSFVSPGVVYSASPAGPVMNFGKWAAPGASGGGMVVHGPAYSASPVGPMVYSASPVGYGLGGNWFQQIFGPGGGASVALLTADPLLGAAAALLANKKRQCDLRFPFNKPKRLACKKAVVREAKAQQAAVYGGGGGAAVYHGGGTVYTGTPAGPVALIPGSSIAPADMSPETDEERAAKSGGGIVDTVTGFAGSIPWWAWAGAAVGVYLLFFRRRELISNPDAYGYETDAEKAKAKRLGISREWLESDAEYAKRLRDRSKRGWRKRR